MHGQTAHNSPQCIRCLLQWRIRRFELPDAIVHLCRPIVECAKCFVCTLSTNQHKKFWNRHGSDAMPQTWEVQKVWLTVHALVISFSVQYKATINGLTTCLPSVSTTSSSSISALSSSKSVCQGRLGGRGRLAGDVVADVTRRARRLLRTRAN